MTKYHKSKKPSSPPQKNQVRIIGGMYKRRLIDFATIDGLRPTPDRLRETLFNWLMNDLQDAAVLDVCAGTGVLGFEALSRGASHATLIEHHKTQAQILTQTAIHLNANATVLQGDCLTILPTLKACFDIVFIDPPYAHALWQPILTHLQADKLIHPNTLLYIEANRPLDPLCKQCSLNIQKSTKIGQIYAYLCQSSSQ